MLGTVLNVLAPPSCAFCGMAGADNAPVCGRCLGVFARIDAVCDRCGAGLAAPGLCGTCQRSPPAFWRLRAPLKYAFPVDAALKRFKFRGQLYFAPAFASLLAPVVRECFSECDALLPVPLHRWRQVCRGFNQADEICRSLVRTIELPIVRPVTRVRSTRSQTGLSAAERRRNLARAFVIRENLATRRPLVVDDVVTTGSTCNELAKCLIEAGAEKVGVLAVARAS